RYGPSCIAALGLPSGTSKYRSDSSRMRSNSPRSSQTPRQTGQKSISTPCRRWPRVRRIAQGHLKHRGDVEDCVQDVWVDLVEQLPALRLDSSRGELRSWISAVTRN